MKRILILFMSIVALLSIPSIFASTESDVEYIVILNDKDLFNVNELNEGNKRNYIAERIPDTNILRIKHLREIKSMEEVRGIDSNDVIEWLASYHIYKDFNNVGKENRFFFSNVEKEEYFYEDEETGYEKEMVLSFIDANETTINTILFFLNHRYLFTEILEDLGYGVNVKTQSDYIGNIVEIKNKVIIEQILPESIRIKIRGKDKSTVDRISNKYEDKIEYLKNSISVPMVQFLTPVVIIDGQGIFHIEHKPLVINRDSAA